MNEPEVGRLDVFQYVTVEKAECYRAVMRVFVAEKAERFGLYLRPREVAAELAELTLFEVEQALTQLCGWGNLEMHHDTSAVSTIEEFHRPRWLYQMSAAGEAAEQAIAAYHDALRRPGELQTVALVDIRSLLGELLALVDAPEVDEAKVYLHLRALCDRFDELTSRAQTFIGSLQRTIDLRDARLDAFIEYKRSLIDYLQRFIGQLVVAAADIAEKLEAFSTDARDRMLGMSAAREVADLFAVTDIQREEVRVRWHRRWDGLRRWFISTPTAVSQAEVLRGQALAAIPRLLRVIDAIHERRVAQSDRVKDLRVLARWFAEADSDPEAMLWRMRVRLRAGALADASDDAVAAVQESVAPLATLRTIVQIWQEGATILDGGLAEAARIKQRKFRALLERGDAGGGAATFNAGAAIVPRTRVIYGGTAAAVTAAVEVNRSGRRAVTAGSS